MKRALALLITFALLGCGAAISESSMILEIPEIGAWVSLSGAYSTEMGDDGFFYVYAREYDSIPYVIIGRYEYPNDGTFIDVFTSMMRGQYADLTVISDEQTVSCAGRSMQKIAYIYAVDGYTITDTRPSTFIDGYTFMFGSKEILDIDYGVDGLLEDVAEDFSLTEPVPESTPINLVPSVNKTPEPTPVSLIPSVKTTTQAPIQTSTGEGVRMKITECVDSATGMTVGRCAAPDGYTVNSETEWCGQWQSAASPARVSLTATSPDGMVMFGYASPVSFVHYVERTIGGVPYAQHVDGQFDTDVLTPMLTFMYADAYADFIITTIFPDSDITLKSQAETSDNDQKIMDERAQYLYDQLKGLIGGYEGTTVDAAYFGAVERTYSLKLGSEDYLATVITATECQQMTIRGEIGYGAGEIVTTTTTWDSPCYYLYLVPGAQYDEIRPAFDLFTQNTIVTDEFTASCEKISQQLRNYMSEKSANSMSAVRDYCQKSLSSSVMDSGDATYDSTGMWTDYIYDRNDYTLSSGDHIKVSTDYDYVYTDGDYVYATNNALDVPYGMEMLNPN